MAVLATLSDVGEDRLHMTLSTGYGLMHAAQWIAGLVVIKFGDSADRLPRTRRMAVLTGHIEVSVRAVRHPIGNLRPTRCRRNGKRY